MSHYPDACFLKSANQASQYVPDEGSEVAFAGRSNAGKSSAINVIVNRRQFARTSKTPGRTQLVNFFSLRNGQRLVDLPGYGFARVSDRVRQHWGGLLSRYFETRRSLAGMFLIVDVRRRLTDYDRQMMAFAESVALPVHVLLTKADKLKKGQAAAALEQVRRELDQLGNDASVQLFSATRREGVDSARVILETMLGGARQHKKNPGSGLGHAPG